jgi:HEAT repeat protein
MESRLQRNFAMAALLVGGVLLAFVFRYVPQSASSRLRDEVAEPVVSRPVPPANPLISSFKRTRRPRVEATQPPVPGTSNAEVALAVLRDSSATLGARRRAAYDLARIGTDEAFSALQTAMPSLPPLVQAAVAEALGSSRHARAPAILLAIWQRGGSDVTARSVAVALGKLGTTECLEALRTTLLDRNGPDSARAAAAAGLGASTDAEALKLLKATFAANQSADLAPQILSAIGQRPFAETRDFFQQVLDAPGAEPELRLAALESLSDVPANGADFFTKYLLDADADIRGEAAWALSATEDRGNLGQQVLGLISGEADAGVRIRLFQALANQETFDVAEAVRVSRAEQDAAVRRAAYEALAAVEASRATTELRDFLDRSAVPDLMLTAIQSRDPSERLQAAMILQQISSAASREAVQKLRAQTNDEAVRRALTGVP